MNNNREGIVRGMINLTQPLGSAELGVHYLNFLSGETTYLEYFLMKIKEIRSIDHIVAFVRPQTESSVLELLNFYSIQVIEIPEHHQIYPVGHRRILASRKWGYQNWAGCPNNYTIFDEIINMGLVGFFKELTNPNKLAYFTPETPFIDAKSTDMMIQRLGEQFEDMTFDYLCRPLPMGLSPFLIGEKSLSTLSDTEVWIPKSLIMTSQSKMPIKIRSAMGFPKLDNERRNFLLRSKRDLRRLQAWNGNFDDMKDLDEVPREIQLEVNTQTHHEAARLPQLPPIPDMAPEQVRSILQDAVQIDDILFTIGDLGNLWHYSHRETLRELLKEIRPYGVHVVFDAVDVFANLDIFRLWVDSDFDIITIRLDALGKNGEDLDVYEPTIKKLMAEFQAPDGRTVLNFEVRKYHDNWKMIHTIQKWHSTYGIAFSWPGYNDYAGQLNHDIRLPVYAPRKRGPCQKLLNQMHILPNGNVTACRQDFSGKTILGNVLQQSIQEVWDSPNFKQLRDRTKEDPLNVTPLCGACRQSFFV